jgi:hypothetical protein
MVPTGEIIHFGLLILHEQGGHLQKPLVMAMFG